MKKEHIFLIVALVALFDLGIIAYKLLKPEPTPEPQLNIQLGNQMLKIEKK